MLWQGIFEDENGAPLPEEIQQVAREVLEHFPGCPLPDCRACEANRDLVAKFIGVVRRYPRVQPS